MAWFVEGKAAVIGIDNGDRYIAGKSSQMATLVTEAGQDLLISLKDAEAWWTIHCNESAERSFEFAKGGFLKLILEHPDKSHFMINYVAQTGANNPAIAFDISLPTASFGECFQLWKGYLFQSKDMHYRFGLDFMGFAEEEAEGIETPTVQQWAASRKPILGSRLSISFHPGAPGEP